MALGFNNYPVNFDASRSILANQSGAILGAGIQGAAQAMMQRAQEKAAKREAKEREKAQREFLGPLIEQLSGGKLQAGDLAAEDLPMAFGMAQQMQERAQKAPLEKLQMENAQLQNELMRIEAERMRTPQPSRVGQTLDVRGVPYVFQNEGQITPVKQPGAADGGAQSTVGKVLADLGAVAELKPGEQAAALRKALERATEPRAANDNPFDAAGRIGLQGQIAQIENEILDLNRQAARGNKRAGPDWVPIGAKTVDKIREKTQELALLKQRLAGLGQPDSAPGGATPGSSFGEAESGGGIDLDAFFGNLQ
jgi:hypothetical protein